MVIYKKTKTLNKRKSSHLGTKKVHIKTTAAVNILAMYGSFLPYLFNTN